MKKYKYLLAFICFIATSLDSQANDYPRLGQFVSAQPLLAEFEATNSLLHIPVTEVYKKLGPNQANYEYRYITFTETLAEASNNKTFSQMIKEFNLEDMEPEVENNNVGTIILTFMAPENVTQAGMNFVASFRHVPDTETDPNLEKAKAHMSGGFSVQ
jgi:hypothetical protein